jgi:hypothetical protein
VEALSSGGKDLIHVNTIHLLNQRTPDDLLKAQLADPTIRPIIQARQMGERPKSEEIQSYPPATRRLFQQWDQLQLKDSVLWRTFEVENGLSYTLQLVVPSSLRQEVLNE